MPSCQTNQSRFFDTGKYLDFDAALLLDGLDKIRGIVCFAHSSSCRGDDSFGATRFSNRTQSLNAISGSQNRIFSEMALHQSFVAQPDEFFFTSEDCKRITRGCVYHQELD